MGIISAFGLSLLICSVSTAKSKPKYSATSFCSISRKSLARFRPREQPPKENFSTSFTAYKRTAITIWRRSHIRSRSRWSPKTSRQKTVGGKVSWRVSDLKNWIPFHIRFLILRYDWKTFFANCVSLASNLWDYINVHKK